MQMYLHYCANIRKKQPNNILRLCPHTVSHKICYFEEIQGQPTFKTFTWRNYEFNRKCVPY